MSSSSAHNKISPGHAITYDVFVANLPSDANEKNVGRLFSKFGEIQSIMVRDDNNTPGTKISYVRFYCDEDSKKAVDECNGCDVDGNTIVVRRTGKNDKRHRKPGEKFQSVVGMKPEKKNDRISNRGPDIVPYEDRPNRHTGTIRPDGKTSRCGQSSPEDPADETVLVSHVENCNVIWVQVVTEDVQEKLLYVTNQLAEVCPKAKKVEKIQLNKIFAAKFSEDQLWYRCIIREPQQHLSSKVRVSFVDYGNEEETCVNNLVEVPPNICEFKPFARKVILNLTKSKKYMDEKGLAFVKEFTNGKLLKLHPAGRLSDGTGIYGELFYDGFSLSDLFVQEGYIVKKTLPQKNNLQNSLSSPNMMPLNCSLQSSRPSSSLGNHAPSLLPTPVSNLEQVNYVNKNTLTHDLREPIPKLHGWLSDGKNTLVQLQSELTSTKQELAQIRQEKDALLLELSNTQSKLKNIQTEYNNKLSENSYHELTKNIITLTEKIRKLRSQFPTNGEGGSSTLTKAIELATSRERMQTLSPSSLNTVNNIISVFNASQKEILNSDKNQADLSELIEARDSTRVKLCESLSMCLADLSNIPLEEKLKQMQDVVNNLGMEYKNFLHFAVHSVPPLADLLPAYTDWKKKKEVEFEKVRSETDSCRKKLSNTLSLIEAHLKLNSTPTIIEEVPNIGFWLRQFTQSLQHEVAITDLEHSRNATFITSILHAVKRELDEEQKTFSGLHRYITEFLKLKEDLSPWLQQKPSLTELQESKKNVRLLKSQLRHRLADLQDVEENEGYNEHHHELKTKLEEVRANLHKCMAEEDQHMQRIADLAERHFPELLLQNTDLGITSYLNYNGMVKAGREPDHYCLEKQIASGVYQTWFNSEEVLIQEHLISDNAPVSREEFLQNAKTYYGIQSPHLVPLQAVFFSKNQRQIFVQLPLIGQPFADYIGESFSEKERQSMIRGLCEGLHKLHSSGIIHGEINPSTVLLKPDRTLVITMPDFSTPLVSRIRNRYVSVNGYSFLAPECQQQSSVEPCPATDVYQLGLMTLLWHDPENKLSSLTDLSETDFPTPVKLFLQYCLREDPRMRVSVNQLLASEYLNLQINATPADSHESQTNSNSPCSSPQESPVQLNSSLSGLVHPDNYNSPTEDNGCKQASISSDDSIVTSIYENLQSPVSNVVQQLSKMMQLSDLYSNCHQSPIDLSSLQFDNLQAMSDQATNQMNMAQMSFHQMSEVGDNTSAGSNLLNNTTHEEFFDGSIADCGLNSTPPLTPMPADFTQTTSFSHSDSSGNSCSFSNTPNLEDGLCHDSNHLDNEDSSLLQNRDSTQIQPQDTLSPTSPLPHLDTACIGAVSAQEQCSPPINVQNLQNSISQVNSSLLSQVEPNQISG
ncbi:serine/threonine-protein kinase 31-like isoform X2 [Octopus vulgaris]|uniref:Serine/threonine-protein kinase 31-like isoform X2 n=1 Tax=Octopus vulgaris TaxID=6645 RepID=A0AA36AWE2_OCTVU|nr:serine/threonine-protein kinase 31-like isoform X2 [Octopus vulgaris]